MAIVNVWFGMQKTAAGVVKTRLRWNEEVDGPYTGPVTDDEHKLFSYMADLPNVERLYAESRIQGAQWVLWTLGIQDKKNVLQKVKAALDALVLKYPTKVSIAGAWHVEFGQPFSRQVGTQYLIESVEQFANDPQFDQGTVIDEDGNTIPDPDWTAPDPWPQISDGFKNEITGVTGTPTYPIPRNALLKFMPDVDGIPATELADVNLGQGWPARRFI